MLTDKLITRFHSVLFNDTVESNEFEWRQILCISEFGVKSRVPFPRLPFTCHRKKFHEELVMSFWKWFREVNPLALQVMSSKWKYYREKMTLNLRSQQQQNALYNIQVYSYNITASTPTCCDLLRVIFRDKMSTLCIKQGICVSK
jgi:hypothetical protein